MSIFPHRRVWRQVLLPGFALLLSAGLTLAQSEKPEPAAAPPETATAAASAAPATPAAPADEVAPKAPSAPADPSPVPDRRERSSSRRSRSHADQTVAVGDNATVRTGQTADEVVVIRGDATIDGDVDGDVVVVLGKLKLNGKVNGDIVVVLGDADVRGEVKGDVALIMTRSRFRSGADVRGGIVAVGVAPDVEPGAKLKDTPEVIALGPLATYLDWAKEYLFQGVFLLRPFPPRLGWVWAAAGVFLVLHLVVALLFAGAMRSCMDTLREQPARSFLVGLLTCMLVGPLSLLLSFTVVATPLIWLVFLALCIFGRVAAYGATGAALGRAGGSVQTMAPVPAVLVGSVLFYLAYMVPVLGYVVYWLVLPWGVGAAVIRLFEALRRERRPVTPPGLPSGAGPGTGGGGSLAAATALATGTPGPATHASVVEPLTGSAESNPLPPPPAGTETVPPPVTPLPGAGATYGPPPLAGLSPVQIAALPRVGFWPRFGAAVIDLVVVAFLNALTFHEARSFWLLLGAYHFAMWGWKGTTLGGSILRLKLIRLDGRPVDWPTAAVRVLGSVVSLLPLGIGFYWASWDDQGQSWHDRVAGTTIVKADRHVALV